MPLDKNAIIREAQKYAARGQIEKAVAEWQKLLKESPHDGNIYNTIGDLYLRIKAQKEAIESYRRAAGIFHKDGFALKALALYKKIININPNQMDAMISLAELNAERGLIGNANENYLAVAEYYTKEGSVSKSLEIYERMVNINPGNINLRLRLADMYMREGRQDDGINKYLEAASAYADKGDIQKSKELYNKVFSYRPKNLDVLKGLCTIYHKEGNYKEACEIIKKAVDLFPERKEVLFLYGKSAYYIDRLEDAKNVFVKYLDAEPGDEEARKFLARVYLKEGRTDASLEEFRIILDGLIQKNELEGAVVLLKEMIDVDPENPKLHNNLADIYRKLGRERDVMKEYEFMASIYINQEDSEKAINTLRTLIGMNPANNEYRIKLQELEGAIAEEIPTIPAFEERPSEERVIVEAEPQEVITMVPERLEGKSEEEALDEADIYLRYGLVDKAIGIIRTILDMSPESIKGHNMLKDIFKNQGMREEFIEECLTLADIYRKVGEEEERRNILNAAIEIVPGDARVLERLGPKIYPEIVEREAVPEEIEEKVVPAVSPKKEVPSDVVEEWIAEADFYAQQGLVEDAIKIYRDILNQQPENEDIRRKMETLSGAEEKVEEVTFVKEEKEEPEPFVFGELPEEKEEEIALIKEEPGTIIFEEPQKEKEEEIALIKEEPEAVVLGETREEFIDFATELREEIEAEVSRSPLEDKNLQEIFYEFKKGVDREIEEKDYETHYNLGIAYKEMGLIDEAISEFQSVAKDPSWYVQASSMLGLCFMEKELYQLAVKEFKKAMDAVGEGKEEYLGLKYDLGNAYEKAGMLDEALSTYADIYGIDAKFREVSSRIEGLKKTVGVVEYPEKKVQKLKKDRVSYL